VKKILLNIASFVFSPFIEENMEEFRKISFMVLAWGVVT